MKKRQAALSLLAAAAIGCSACGGQPAVCSSETAPQFTEPLYTWNTQTGKTLSLWTQKGELDRVYMQRAFARYEESTGNQLEIVEYPKEQFVEKTASSLLSGENAPDILASYGGANIDAFNPDENFYDFTQAEWVDDLTDTSINQTIYHGKVIGLPHWEASISGTLYNKKIFKKLAIEVPKTQEEFLAACDKLLENGITPVFLPGGELSMLLYQFPLDTLVQDSQILDGLNEGRLGYADLPEMKTVLEWYKTMGERGYFGSTYRTDGWAGMNEAMASGQFAMMLCWDTWLYTDFKGDASDFGLMPAFIGIPEEGTFEGPNLALLTVNRHSPQLDAAVEFVTFMADPYNYNVAFEGIYTAPVFKNQVNSISTPQYAESERLIERNYRDSTAWLRIRGFSQIDASCILDFMDGRCTAEECLAEMDRLRVNRANGQIA